MKVALLTAYDHLGSDYGGSEISTFLLAKGLVSLGVEPHILTIPSSYRKASENVDGVYFHRIFKELKSLKVDGSPLFLILISKIMAKRIYGVHLNEAFDVIHAQNRDVSTGGILAQKITGASCILHIRDFWPICLIESLYPNSFSGKCIPNSTYCINCFIRNRRRTHGSFKSIAGSTCKYIQRFIRKRIIQQVAHIIVASRFVKDILVENGFCEATISIIPNPIEIVDQTRPIRCHSLAKRLLFIGPIRKDKGALDLPPLMDKLWEVYPHLELTVVGSGPLENRLRQHFYQTNPEHVKFTGWLPYSQVNKAYHKSDIVVLPFRRPEAFGRVVAEAMAAGKSVVSYRVGGVPEIIEDGVTGFLVDDGDVHSLYEAVIRLVMNKKIRERFGKSGREYISKRYNPIQIAKQTIQIYEKFS